MAKNITYSQKFLLAALETVPGDKETLTGSQAIRTQDLAATIYDGETYSPKFDGDTGRVQANIRTNAHNTMSFVVDAAGSGDNDSPAPAYGILLQACGFSETVTAPGTPGDGTGKAVYTNNDSGTIPTATLGFIRGTSQEYVTYGARGAVSFSISNGVPQFTFTDFKGAYETPKAVASAYNPVFGNQAMAVPVSADNTGTMSIDGMPVCVSDFSLAGLGNTVVRKDYVNCNSTGLTPEPITGSITVLADDIAVKNWFSQQETSNGVDYVSLEFENGTKAGNIFGISFAEVQISNVQETDLDGQLGYSMDINAKSNPVITIK